MFALSVCGWIEEALPKVYSTHDMMSNFIGHIKARSR